MAKSYQLAAWTDRGQVKMLPSLVEDLAKPYLRSIEAAENEECAYFDAEIDQLLRRSRAYERLGRFYRRVGYRQEAFACFAAAAKCCTEASDWHWSQSDGGYVLTRPLKLRFLAMHDTCLRLLEESPELAVCYLRENLAREYASVTRA